MPIADDQSSVEITLTEAGEQTGRRDSQPRGEAASSRLGGPPRWLPGLASLLLLATGLFHATGTSGVVEIVADPAFGRFYSRALPGVWAFFSWHLIALALGAGWAAVRAPASARPLLVFLALVGTVDTLFVGAGAGPLFIGTLMLAAAAACLGIAAARW